jgi:hypothetical protein
MNRFLVFLIALTVAVSSFATTFSTPGNFGTSTLATGISAEATTVVVASGAVFPAITTNTYPLVIGVGTEREIVTATALTTNTFTVTRAAESTTGVIHATGVPVILSPTAGYFTELQNACNTPVCTGAIAANGAAITTDDTTFALINTNATTINFGGAATALNVGAATGYFKVLNATLIADKGMHVGGTGAVADNALEVDGVSTLTGNVTMTGDAAVNGGDFTSTATTFNMLQTTAPTTINFGGAATAITMGAATGAFTVNNATLVAAKGLHVGGAAAVADNAIEVDGISTLTGDVTCAADWAVNGGDITSSSATVNLFNETAPTTINFGGDATTVSIGDATGTTTINNANTAVTGDLAVNGGDITSSAATVNFLNATAPTTINMGGDATTVGIGDATGTCTINNASLVAAGDLAVNGGDITTDDTTASVFNATATTLNIGAEATTINLGAVTGAFVVNNATLAAAGGLHVGGTAGVTDNTLTVDGESNLVGNVTMTGDLALNGADLTSTAATVGLFDATTTKIDFGGAAAIDVGKTGLATTVKGTLNVDEAVTFDTTLGVTGDTTLTGDIAVNGADVTSTAATVNLFNATTTKLNVGGAAAIDLGVTSLATTVKGTLNVDEAATFDTTVGVTGVLTHAATCAASCIQFAQDDATPTVAAGNVFRCYGKEGLTITNFDNPVGYQEITILGTFLNEVQTITVTNGNDTDAFTITYAGQTTASLLWNVSAANMILALEALSNIAVGDVAITEVGGVYTVRFQGVLAETDVAEMTSTPTTCDVAHATTAIGGAACTSVVDDCATIQLASDWAMTGGATLKLVYDSKKTLWRELCRAAS